VSAIFAVPVTKVFATPSQPEGKAACADLTGELTNALTSVTSALLPQVTIPPALPDVNKATGIVGKLTSTATNLVNLGCLPDPAKAVALPVGAKQGVAAREAGVSGGAAVKLPLPGVPLPTASSLLPLPGVPLPTASSLLPVPSGSSAPSVAGVPACAAPAAGLLSQLFGLLQTLLQLLAGSGLPDVTGALSQVTGLQSTVTGLTTSTGGATSCLQPSTTYPLKRYFKRGARCFRAPLCQVTAGIQP